MIRFLYERIHENYMQQWVVDNMPVTWCYSIVESNKPYCTTRFPVGCYVTPEGVPHDACYLSVRKVYYCRVIVWQCSISKDYSVAVFYVGIVKVSSTAKVVVAYQM